MRGNTFVITKNTFDSFPMHISGSFEKLTKPIDYVGDVQSGVD